MHTQKARLLQTSFDQYRFVSSFFDVFHEWVWFPDGALYSHRCSNWGPAFVNLRGEGKRERESRGGQENQNWTIQNQYKVKDQTKNKDWKGEWRGKPAGSQ